MCESAIVTNLSLVNTRSRHSGFLTAVLAVTVKVHCGLE